MTYTKFCLEYGTDRPCEIGRFEYPDGLIVLGFRYLDNGGDWFATWVGPRGDAVKLPTPGWPLPRDVVDAFNEASSRAGKFSAREDER